MRNQALRAIALVISCGATAAQGAPWMMPGDEGLRSDIQLLADAGIVHTPVTTWPISWPDVARDVALVDVDADLDEGVRNALMRIQRLARTAAARGVSLGAAAGATNDAPQLRGFDAGPREEGEVSLQAAWLGEHVAGVLRATAALDPQDDRVARLDGSYLSVSLWNFAVSAGYIDRWWGPGWEGSLILSTNARPVPGVTIERNYSDPFRSPWLSWIGPWRASFSIGETEAHDVAVPRTRLFAARVNFKPRPWLEFGLSRTAQWCGEGRPCGLGTFRDLLIGRDNQDESLSAADEPGNQLAGYDARVRSPWRRLPLALYTQWIGEDEAGGMPSKFMGQFGAETWHSWSLGTLRAHFEYADTTCTFTRELPDFNCGYRSGVYPQGYTYHGRIIGHSLDNDSRQYSFGATLTRLDGDVFGFTVRRADINRDGGAHAISDVPARLDDVELRFSRVLGIGTVNLSVGYLDTDAAVSSSGIRGYLTWEQGF